MKNKAIKRVAVITGGTKGIGRALIERFAKGGFDVITCSRGTVGMESLKQEINRYGTSLHHSQVDLSSERAVVDFVEEVKSQCTKLDVLINNAGVFIPGEVLTEENGNLEQMIHTNLFSAYRLTRGVIPLIRKAERPHIFNMCSTASTMAYANGGSYAISKFALYGFSKSLREELKQDNIKVTSVLPGATYTPSWEGVDIPEDRFMSAADIANLVWAAYDMQGNACVEDLLVRPQLGDL